MDYEEEQATEDHMIVHRMVEAVNHNDLDLMRSIFHDADRPDEVLTFMILSIADGDDHYVPHNHPEGAQTAVALLTAKVTDNDFLGMVADLIAEEPDTLIAAIDTLTDMTLDQITSLAAHHGADPEDQEASVLETLKDWGRMAAEE